MLLGNITWLYCLPVLGYHSPPNESTQSPSPPRRSTSTARYNLHRNSLAVHASQKFIRRIHFSSRMKRGEHFCVRNVTDHRAPLLFAAARKRFEILAAYSSFSNGIRKKRIRSRAYRPELWSRVQLLARIYDTFVRAR